MTCKQRHAITDTSKRRWKTRIGLQTRDREMGIFDPPTFETAMEGIKAWDRSVKNMPLLSEQMRIMKDGPQTWSTTHDWPAVREQFRSLGLVKDLPATVYGDRWRVPTTEITELGRKVRDALQASPTK